MPRSMTGFGQAKRTIDHRECVVEIRSVNHRFLDFSVRLPGALSSFELDLRERVAAKVKRGKVNVYVSWNGEPDFALALDTNRVRQYVGMLRRLAKSLKLKCDLSVSDLTAVPNLFTASADPHASHKTWSGVERVLEEAIGRMVRMREEEGKRLARDLTQRIAMIRRSAKAIEQTAKDKPERFKERLEKRIAELTGGLTLSEEALSKEIALFADRADITEELVRLDHHLEFFGSTLKQPGELGKRLDFITQEILREVNTIASKSANFPIAKEVVSMKAELEKIREQIQNIE